jgi:hypothetical protein
MTNDLNKITTIADYSNDKIHCFCNSEAFARGILDADDVQKDGGLVWILMDISQQFLHKYTH